MVIGTENDASCWIHSSLLLASFIRRTVTLTMSTEPDGGYSKEIHLSLSLTRWKNNRKGEILRLFVIPLNICSSLICHTIIHVATVSGFGWQLTLSIRFLFPCSWTDLFILLVWLSTFLNCSILQTIQTISSLKDMNERWLSNVVMIAWNYLLFNWSHWHLSTLSVDITTDRWWATHLSVGCRSLVGWSKRRATIIFSVSFTSHWRWSRRVKPNWTIISGSTWISYWSLSWISSWWCAMPNSTLTLTWTTQLSRPSISSAISFPTIPFAIGWIQGVPNTFWKNFSWAVPLCGNDGRSLKNIFGNKIG